MLFRSVLIGRDQPLYPEKQAIADLLIQRFKGVMSMRPGGAAARAWNRPWRCPWRTLPSDAGLPAVQS